MLSQICRCLLLAIGLLMASLNASIAAAQDSPLQWRFAKGDKFAIVLDQTSSVETTVDRREVSQKTELNMSVSWSVDSVDDDGTARITQRIQGVRITLDLPGAMGRNIQKYDSNSDEKPTGDATRLKASFDCIVDQPVTVIINRKGEITDVEIPKETMARLREMPASMQGREAFTPESIRETFSQATIVFPDKPLANGDSWSSERAFSMPPQKFKQVSTYTFQGPTSETSIDQIDIRSELSVDNTNSKTDENQIEIIDQSLSGTLLFDRDGGHCSESISNTMMVTRVPYRDMEITSRVKSQLKMSFTRDN